MEIIAHRINTVDALIHTPNHLGVEVDIRSDNQKLIIHHDPFEMGELFENWLQHYNHGTLILNVKEEGLEESVLQLMEKYNIKSYFFLDQSFPFLVKWAEKGLHNSAVRFSEFEAIETALSLSGKIDWVWVDCFTQLTLTKKKYDLLKSGGFKVCLVSPELQGRASQHDIEQMQQYVLNNNIRLDAVCTKVPNMWKILA